MRLRVLAHLRLLSRRGAKRLHDGVIQAWTIPEAQGDRSVIESDPEWRVAGFFKTGSKMAAKLLALWFDRGKISQSPPHAPESTSPCESGALDLITLR
jgi:hypothetical protein